MFDIYKAWGLLMGLTAAIIGGGWQVATRHATATGLSPIAPEDLIILRYGVPALLLMPIIWRGGLLPRHFDRRMLLLMVIGAGLPFGFAAMSGTRFAPSSHMGVLMAGASPLIAAGLAWWISREVPSGARRVGMVFMLAAVMLLGAQTLVDWSTATWRGDLLFLLAALLWAVYTVTFKRTGLSPWHAAALVNVWSFLLVLAWMVARGGTQLLDAPASTLAWQVVWQGLLAGVLGLWAYSVAIERLGAAPAAAFGALAPAISAVGGWWWLGDSLFALDLVSVSAAVFGVLLASGVWPAQRH